MINYKLQAKRRKQSFIVFLFTFFCFVPYLRVIPIDTDSQPNGLILAMIIAILYGNYNLKPEFVALGSVFFFSLVGLCFDHDWNAMRSIVNYLSIFIIPYATFKALQLNGINYKLWKMSIVIWGVFGCVQLFINPEFGSVLLSRTQNVSSRLETGRGVISLAPEPTFYGIICLLLFCVGYLNFKYDKNIKMWFGILLVQFLILSRSSTCIFVVLLSAATYVVIIGFKRKPKILITGILGLCLVVFAFKSLNHYIADFRAGRHLLMVLDDPTKFMLMDPSVNERFIHAFFPIYGFFQNFGLPHFYNEFNDYMRHIYYSWDFIDYISYFRNNYTRIMSGVGCSLYELGIVGLIIWIVLFKDIIIMSKRDSTLLFIGILYFYIMLNAMPLTNALVGFVFGNIIYRRYYPLTK